MGFFTSGLSVKEYALLDRLGPVPLGQVMGASVVQTGWQYLPALPAGTVSLGGGFGGRAAGMTPSPSAQAYRNRMTDASAPQVRTYQWRTPVVCELSTISDAWNLGRRQAVDRVIEEAMALGADAVVGVRLERSGHDFGDGVVEYVVRGTAIRLPALTGGPPPGPDAAPARPALTDLSVQDYWRLVSAGHEPCGLLAATTVVFASPPQATRLARARQTRSNLELDELSRAFHTARDTIRARLRGQISDHQGVGSVGVSFDHAVARGRYELASSIQSPDRIGWHRGRLGLPYKVSGGTGAKRSGWMITMHAVGTAIRSRTSPSPFEPSTRLGLR